MIPLQRISMVCDGHLEAASGIAGDPRRAAAIFHELWNDSPQEIMGALYLNTHNNVIGYAELYRGTISRAVCEPRLILQHGLMVNAVSMILGHCHPSGIPTPSVEDVAFTRRLTEAGDIIGIRLVDHLVIACGSGNEWQSVLGVYGS